MFSSKKTASPQGWINRIAGRWSTKSEERLPCEFNACRICIESRIDLPELKDCYRCLTFKHDKQSAERPLRWDSKCCCDLEKWCKLLKEHFKETSGFSFCRLQTAFVTLTWLGEHPAIPFDCQILSSWDYWIHFWVSNNSCAGVTSLSSGVFCDSDKNSRARGANWLGASSGLIVFRTASTRIISF